MTIEQRIIDLEILVARLIAVTVPTNELPTLRDCVESRCSTCRWNYEHRYSGQHCAECSCWVQHHYTQINNWEPTAEVKRLLDADEQ